MSNYKQYDTRWCKLPYRENPDNIGNNGCGEVSVCNAITEMESQKNQTPKTMQPYCKQFACHDGTYWSGIPKMLEHYGCTEVKEHQNMASLWKELAKGDRIAVYMMNSYPAGYKQIHWTSGGHFICSTKYRYNSKNGEHEVFVKDSNSKESYRIGWMSYESSLRGDVSACWSGKIGKTSDSTTKETNTVFRPTTDYKGKLPKKKVKEGDTGSDVKRAQEFLNWSLDAKLKVDGEYGPKTVKACKKFQKRYGVEGNGGFGWRTKMIACCQIQAVWMRKATYGEWKPVTKAHTKTYGTCVTYVGVVLQRYGLLKSGQYIWHNGKGYGTGKVYGTNDDMEVTYLKNKSLKSLKDRLRAGDVILCDDNKSGVSGGGGHIFIITDKWDDKGNPYIWDVGMKMLCEKNGKPRKYDGSHKVLARVRPKER